MNTEKLKKLRKSMGLTQSDVARLLGFSAQRYNYYETGKREPDNATLKALGELFDVSIDYLLDRTNDPSTPTLIIPEELQDARVAFHHGEEDLTQDEVDKIAAFIRFIKSEREKEDEETEGE